MDSFDISPHLLNLELDVCYGIPKPNRLMYILFLKLRNLNYLSSLPLLFNHQFTTLLLWLCDRSLLNYVLLFKPSVICFLMFRSLYWRFLSLPCLIGSTVETSKKLYVFRRVLRIIPQHH